MKFVIAHGETGLKRNLIGNFSLCGSRDDLTRLIGCVQYALDHEPGMTYGWVEVYEPRAPLPVDQGPPVPWGLGR